MCGGSSSHESTAANETVTTTDDGAIASAVQIFSKAQDLAASAASPGQTTELIILTGVILLAALFILAG